MGSDLLAAAASGTLSFVCGSVVERCSIPPKSRQPVRTLGNIGDCPSGEPSGAVRSRQADGSFERQLCFSSVTARTADALCVLPRWRSKSLVSRQQGGDEHH